MHLVIVPSLALNLRLTEFTQCLSLGSGLLKFSPRNKCPKCEVHAEQTISMRPDPSLSSRSSTESLMLVQKPGHPQPQSNFMSDVYSGVSHAAQRYSPPLTQWSSKPPIAIPIPRGSVLALRRTRNCVRDKFCAKKASPLSRSLEPTVTVAEAADLAGRENIYQYSTSSKAAELR